MEWELIGSCEWLCLDPPYIPGAGTSVVDDAVGAALRARPLW